MMMMMAAEEVTKKAIEVLYCTWKGSDCVHTEIARGIILDGNTVVTLVTLVANEKQKFRVIN